MKSRFAPRFPLLLLFACSLDVGAHQGSTSYLSLAVEEDRIRGHWEIPVRDLDLALGLDSDKNRKVTLDELQERFAEVKSYALRHLKLTVDGLSGGLTVTNRQAVIETFHDGASTALDFVITNISHPTNLEVEYRFMFDHKPEDRAFIQVECRSITQTGVFTADQPFQRFDLKARKSGDEFRAFCRHGIWHIWIGFDHILFLVALLLPAVLRREQNQWTAAPNFRQAFISVFKVVTAFTVAHSLTLSLAALQILTLRSRWAESAIAASVMVAALNNIWPVVHGRVWLVAFAFGLIHGFGFSSVLTELGLPRNALFLALVGFNLGVEAGQLAMVAVFLPLAFALRRSGFYRMAVLKLGSALIALLAGLWLVERLFNLEILRV